MPKSTLLAFVLFTLFLDPNLINANILIVPDVYPSVQSAIHEANPFDTIMIKPGVYRENLKILSKPLTITSYYEVWDDMTIREATIIDGDHKDGTMVISHTDSIVTLKGFTLTNGLRVSGAGLAIEFSTGILKDMIITGNRAFGGLHSNGGGIAGTNANLKMINCEVSFNTADDMGGGISLRTNCMAILDSVEFISNTVYQSGGHGKGGGLFTDYSSLVELSRCVFSENAASRWGGGMAIASWSKAEILNSTFSDNIAILGGGALYTCYESCEVFIGNTIMYENIPNEICFDGGCWNTSIQICYSDIQNSEQTYIPYGNSFQLMAGLIDEYPRFIAPWYGDYTLSPDSPCIDAGTKLFIHSGDTLINIDDSIYHGAAPDMGAYEFDPFVGVDSQEPEQLDINVWPQPASDYFNVALPVSIKEVQCRITDLHGRKLMAWSYSSTSNLIKIPVAVLSPGIYILILYNHDFTYSRKVLIN